MEYLSDKKKCFICNTEIESTEERLLTTPIKENEKMEIDNN